MAFSQRARSAAGIATAVALVLVIAFGNSSYRDWAGKHAGSGVGGVFLGALSWPQWTFDTNLAVRDLLAVDLRAILVVVLTFVFVMLLEVGAVTAGRRTIGQILAGWGGFMFAGAFAGLIGALIASGSSLTSALGAAELGVAYGLLVGWIVGLITLAAPRGSTVV